MPDDPILNSNTLTALDALRARTPARLVVGRAGPAYRTSTQLELREDHAVAVDAVRAELDLECDLGREFVDAGAVHLRGRHERARRVRNAVDTSVRVVAQGIACIVLHVTDEDIVPVDHVQ